jgi:hypothetical protein
MRGSIACALFVAAASSAVACGPANSSPDAFPFPADSAPHADAPHADAAPAVDAPGAADANPNGAPLNETGSAAEADYCVNQFPMQVTVAPGAQVPFFGQLYEAGLTDASATPAAGVTASLGLSPAGAASDPRFDPAWTFTAGAPNAGYDFAQNNDEYTVTITAPSAGVYRFAWRFSFDGGASWTYCDDDGAGSNSGLDFAAAQTGTLTVQ